MKMKRILKSFRPKQQHLQQQHQQQQQLQQSSGAADLTGGRRACLDDDDDDDDHIDGGVQHYNDGNIDDDVDDDTLYTLTNNNAAAHATDGTTGNNNNPSASTTTSAYDEVESYYSETISDGGGGRRVKTTTMVRIPPPPQKQPLPQAAASPSFSQQQQQQQQQHLRCDETRNLVKKFIADIWNRGALDLIPEVCSPSLRFNGNTGFDRVGHDGLARMVATIRDALDEYHCEIHSMVVEDNKAFCRLRFTGKHVGPLLGHAPTKRTVAWMGATEFTCQNGKILKVWELGDVKSLEEQLVAQDD